MEARTGFEPVNNGLQTVPLSHLGTAPPAAKLAGTPVCLRGASHVKH